MYRIQIFEIRSEPDVTGTSDRSQNRIVWSLLHCALYADDVHEVV